MTFDQSLSPRTRPARLLLPVTRIAAAVALVAACAQSIGAQTNNSSPGAPNPDPRVGLHAGKYDAGEAMWNMKVVSKTRPSAKFVDITNSDLAFTRNYVIQGSYAGYQIWD